jgi:hypothetical protein
MAFAKGQSGNPGGRPQSGYIKGLARAYTKEALETLAAALKAENESTRVAAANSLLDRGWGKPAQAVVGGDEEDSPVRVITEIKRVIVRPDNRDG